MRAAKYEIAKMSATSSRNRSARTHPIATFSVVPTLANKQNPCRYCNLLLQNTAMTNEIYQQTDSEAVRL